MEPVGHKYLVCCLQKLTAAGLSRHPLGTYAAAGGNSHIGPFAVLATTGSGGLSCKSTLE